VETTTWAGILKTVAFLPLWLLTAITVILTSALVIPAFNAMLSAEKLLPWAQFGAFSFGVLTVFCLASHVLSQLLGRRHARRRQEERAFERVYKPADALFMDRFPLGGPFPLAPRLSHRVRHAIDALQEYAGWRSRIRMTWRALFDRKIRELGGEMEFGGSFPLDRILEIIDANKADVDRELWRLARLAKYSTYTDVGEEVTAAEIRLFAHITDRTDRLRRRYE